MKLSELCRLIEASGIPARYEGGDCTLRAVSTIEEASEGDVTFLSNPKYARAVADTRASAVILKDGVSLPPHVSAIRCGDPYAAVTVAIIKLHGHRRHPRWGISERAVIDPSARIGADANIANNVSIAAGVTIGDRCTIYAGCYIAQDVRIKDDCTLYPNVVVYDGCELGHRVTIHAGSVIGEDGLGYAPQGEQWVKIPQIGRVVIGDDVEIGANCAIDRATLGQTEIGDGTKFGNVVVIGHGTKIGPHCLFVGHVGIAGSVTVGRHVTLAGQVGVAGHITIGDNARVGAQAGVASNIEPGADVLGAPAMPIDKAKRAVLATQKLPDWIKRVKDLEREIAQLKARVGRGG